jgi:hypothetical protein
VRHADAIFERLDEIELAGDDVAAGAA